MAQRMGRWVGLVLVPGLFPLLAMYGVTLVAGDRAPSRQDLLTQGDTVLVAIAWAVAALADLTAMPRATVRDLLIYTTTVLLVAGGMAYGCLTTVSVTGRVQTPVQQDIAATWSSALLALGVAASATATAMAARRR